jgi:hypothetical protein
MGTKKYNLAGMAAGLSFVVGSFFLISSYGDGVWLKRNNSSKGWRQEGNYTVVDYDYYKKEQNRGKKNIIGALAFFSTAAGLGYYSRKKSDFKAQFEDEIFKFEKNLKKQKDFEKKIKNLEKVLKK